MTALDVITDALREIGVLNAVDAASAEDAALGLLRLNRLIDDWNGDGLNTGLATVALSDDLALTAGYATALTLTLAEHLAPAFRVGVSPDTQREAGRARARVRRLATTIPTLSTRDAGMPDATRQGDIYTGQSS